MHVVGLMSGTSGDGVDAALVDITGRDRSLKARTLAAHTLPYPRSLQQRILSRQFLERSRRSVISMRSWVNGLRTRPCT